MDGGESRGPHCLAIGLLLDGRKDALSCQSDRWSSAADPMHDLLNIYIVAIASGHQPPCLHNNGEEVHPSCSTGWKVGCQLPSNAYTKGMAKRRSSLEQS